MLTQTRPTHARLNNFHGTKKALLGKKAGNAPPAWKNGKSKGMAVVSFIRAGDAVVARTKYNGKIVDGRKPIKVEIIVDNDLPATTTPSPTIPSLFSRLGPSTPTANNAPKPHVQVNLPPKTASTPNPQTSRPAVSTQVPPKRRVKKGPRRLNKRQPLASKSKEDLDKEMDDYLASAA
ncbi:hypothetical protein ONZ45_g6404 [Pleurotus djamor]|nr:hypothetical protein ONZ45_g6404 [Pleurotus djamor]